MTDWISARAEHFCTFEGNVDYEHGIPVQVKIEGDDITVDYSPCGATDVYIGKVEAEGSYRLFRDGGGGSGTLHKVPGRNLLEGFWDEGEARGTWRLHLDEEFA